MVAFGFIPKATFFLSHGGCIRLGDSAKGVNMKKKHLDYKTVKRHLQGMIDRKCGSACRGVVQSMMDNGDITGAVANQLINWIGKQGY